MQRRVPIGKFVGGVKVCNAQRGGMRYNASQVRGSGTVPQFCQQRLCDGRGIFAEQYRQQRVLACPFFAPATALLNRGRQSLESAFKDPVLVVITYRDGLRAGLLWASNLIDFTADH